MKKIAFPFLLLFAPFFLTAETVILYLQPTLRSPVIGTLPRDSEAFRNAKQVDGDPNWMATERRDFYSGFIARDSLTPEGEVEVGTTVLMTPSRGGTVLLTVEEGDPVTINLVDRWTEITVEKTIPAFFRNRPPRSERATEGQGADRILHSDDPLIARIPSTRYRSSRTPARGELTTTTSRPVAAASDTGTLDPMTGFEDAERLNPAATASRLETDVTVAEDTRTSLADERRDRQLRESTQTRAPGAAATSLSDPLSLSRIPAEMPEGTEAPMPPDQADAVDEIQDVEASAIEGRTPDIVQAEVDLSSPILLTDPGMTDDFDIDAADNVEIIPLVPLTSAPATRTPTPSVEAPTVDTSTEAVEGPILAPLEVETPAIEEVTTEESVKTAEIPAEESATIVIPAAESDITVDVEEAVLPGIPEAELETVPQLRPATDLNRTYVGVFRRTRSFLGMGPDYDFELMNSQGRRIAFVDLSSLPMSSPDRFAGKIVRIHGTIEEASDGRNILIRAVNIALR